MLGCNDSFTWLNKQELAWRDKLTTNKFCYHGDHFKQTRLSTGETQARMNRERGSVCLWICEDVGKLLENTAGSKVSAVLLLYVNWFNIINMALIAEKKKKISYRRPIGVLMLSLE